MIDFHHLERPKTHGRYRPGKLVWIVALNAALWGLVLTVVWMTTRT